MSAKAEKLATKIRSLAEIEKLQLVDSILSELDQPDPEIDRVWAEEARRRWKAYQAERLQTVSYRAVMERHHQE